MRGRPLATMAILTLATTSACTRTNSPSPTGHAVERSVQNSAAPVVLPDLSGIAESVQRQIRERDGALKQTLQRSGATAAEQAAAYGALGRLLMAAGFSKDAAACFSHAEALVPEDMRWPYYSGHVSLRLGDRADAAAAFERALKIRPSDPMSLVWLGEAYLDDDRLDLAQSAFQRALRVQPSSAPALFGAGRIALAKREYAEAVQHLERALAIDARASAIQYPLAMAYRGLGDTAQSENHLRQRGSNYPVLRDPLMEVDEDAMLHSAVSFENRGMAALRAAEFDLAIAEFIKGLQLAPDDTSLRYWLGAARYASGDAEGAFREFSAVLRREPDHAKAHFSIGAIYDAKQQRGKAIEEYQAAVRGDPTLPEARVRLAEDLRSSGQLAASVEQYEAAVKLDPSQVDAWIGGAHALVDVKRNDQARDWLARARTLFPNRAELAVLQASLNKK